MKSSIDEDVYSFQYKALTAIIASFSLYFLVYKLLPMFYDAFKIYSSKEKAIAQLRGDKNDDENKRLAQAIEELISKGKEKAQKQQEENHKKEMAKLRPRFMLKLESADDIRLQTVHIDNALPLAASQEDGDGADLVKEPATIQKKKATISVIADRRKEARSIFLPPALNPPRSDYTRTSNRSANEVPSSSSSLIALQNSTYESAIEEDMKKAHKRNSEIELLESKRSERERVIASLPPEPVVSTVQSITVRFRFKFESIGGKAHGAVWDSNSADRRFAPDHTVGDVIAFAETREFLPLVSREIEVIVPLSPPIVLTREMADRSLTELGLLQNFVVLVKVAVESEQSVD